MGVGFGTFNPSCGAVLQLNVADAMFGRIMALFTVAVLGSTAIGARPSVVLLNSSARAPVFSSVLAVALSPPLSG